MPDRFSRAFGAGRGAARNDFAARVSALGQVDLSGYAGCFAEGWSNDCDTGELLEALSGQLGYELVIFWEEAAESLFDDRYVFSGRSELCVLDDEDCLRSAPGGLTELLCFDGGVQPAGLIDASSVGAVIAWPHQLTSPEPFHAASTAGTLRP